MRKILFGLIGALLTTTAIAKGGPPTVKVHYDLGLFTLSQDVTPRDAGQLFAQCQSRGTIELLGLTVPCTGLDREVGPGGTREITIYLDFLF